MATIREISEQAHVSIATVSKVLNGKGGVSQATQDMILELARELGYRPNLYARSLKRGQSLTLGIITEDLTVFNAAEIVDGIDTCCEARGYHYILGNLRFNKRFGHRTTDTREAVELSDALVDTMLSKQVDGIIYIGCHNHAVAPLSACGEVPMVYAYCYSAAPGIPSVLYDDTKAGYDVTRLLLSAGHKQVGVIAGLRDSVHTANRLTGYQEALFEAGIPYNPHMTVYGDWERDGGYALAPKLISAGATAIFAQNDLMATGVIDYCNANGIAVGQDIALIGFDNREVSSVCRPTLSTVSLPLFEIGQTAANLLLNKLIDQTEFPQEKVLLPCSIIQRESTTGVKEACSKP
ncbi:MAG: LacI family DNA-binding transcriptional regulator [Eubacteriales bacterium]|nr:LacI family DNA-binding transcriptional regulator [Eubacteriales bacterium]